MIIVLSIFLLLSPFFTFLCPVSFSRIGAMGREGCFFLLILFAGFKIFFNKVKFQRIQLVLFIFICIELLYCIIYPTNFGVILIYTSGPILFFTISCIKINNIPRKIRIITILTSLFIILNLLIYRYQYLLLAVARVNSDDVWQHLYRNGSIRLFGITFMPTIMAFICILSLVFSNNMLMKYISIFAWYLTGARLFIPGLFISIYHNLKKKFKVYLSFFFIIFGLFLIYYITSNADDSIIKHLDDLFVKGPTLFIENFYGCVFSKDISIESDLFIYFIRFGLLVGLFYTNIFFLLFRIYNKKTLFDDSIIKKGRNLLIIYFMASIFLPLTLQRPLCNMFWLYEGLIFSYRRQLCMNPQ